MLHRGHTRAEATLHKIADRNAAQAIMDLVSEHPPHPKLTPT